VKIEPMRWWHIEPALAIEQELFGAERWSAGMFWSELAADDRWYRVALDGEDLLGYAGLCVYPDASWVQNIAVRRASQGRGIGAALLDELLAEAARRGAPVVALEVAADNATARRLYERRGFTLVGVRKGYYQPSNTDAWVMEKAMEK
jgi:ribosomal-protein-alanine N-acetyltransferase